MLSHRIPSKLMLVIPDLLSILLSVMRCSSHILFPTRRIRVLSAPAAVLQDVVPYRPRTRPRVLAGCAAAGSWSGGQADGYTAPVRKRRLCKRPVKDKLRERLAKQPKIPDKSLRERMSRNLVLSMRALRGWRRVARIRSRKPLPWPMVAALGLRMIAHNRCDLAWWSLVCFSAYLRPKEAFGLQRRDLVPPRGGAAYPWALLTAPLEREDRTKTGDPDDRAALVTPFLRWVSQALETLKEGPVDSPPWDVDYPELLAMFVRAAKELRIKAVPCQLRHAGPSWDRIMQLRTAVAVRKRGRWRRQASRARYEKHARVAADHRGFTEAQVVHFDTCAKRLEALPLKGGAPPAVPRL